jgi:hypothetical protein
MTSAAGRRCWRRNAETFAEGPDHFRHIPLPVRQCQSLERFQRVVQKMRVNLRLKRAEFRLLARQ